MSGTNGGVEMLIRSQNKKVIVSMPGMSSIAVYLKAGDEYYDPHETDGVGCNSWIIQSHHTLGEYSTEEKAIKVLDMICKFANCKHFERVVPDKCESIDGVVFQMPQDSEVENEADLVRKVMEYRLENGDAGNIK